MDEGRARKWCANTSPPENAVHIKLIRTKSALSISSCPYEIDSVMANAHSLLKAT